MLNRALLGAAVLALTAPFAMAGPIDSACARSARASGNGSVCNCIQQVADQTLSPSDQRRAAAFFRDPDQAQSVRMSKTGTDNAFWARYKNFATTAEAYCAR
ncbi:hypothetical protein DRW48_12910 [Paracoccus suum]|uniref:Arginine transporter n=1 Tax=Paracoccus suum TaxID=2259340 RepID=A0A344PM54_9RHOB|nr:hypothetical protein [Paracoccus suum]AXC50459.1 hypothetical protein DRW48_12910 [Paracoccus suum]